MVFLFCQESVLDHKAFPVKTIKDEEMDSRLWRPKRSEGTTKGLRVSKSLSYHWLRYLTDLEFNHVILIIKYFE